MYNTSSEHIIAVKPAQMDEYDDVERFYSGLIDSMSDSEFKPEWEMGVYPSEEFLKNAINKQTLYLVHLEGNLAGVMILNHDGAPEYENVKWQTDVSKNEVIVIHALGVSPAFQGRGVAGQMVANVIEMCRKDAVKAIRLDVLPKNLPAIKLYLSMGFKFITSVKMYYEDTGLTDFQLYELLI